MAYKIDAGRFRVVRSVGGEREQKDFEAWQACWQGR